jgi:hypothetical protein
MSKATIIDKIKIMSAITTGRIKVQHTTINLSYRSLGNVALNHTKAKQNKQVLSANITLCKFIYVSLTKISGNT